MSGHTKTIKVRYLIIKALSSYNIILGHLPFNILEEALFILYMTIEYPFDNGQVGVLKGD